MDKLSNARGHQILSDMPVSGHGEGIGTAFGNSWRPSSCGRY